MTKKKIIKILGGGLSGLTAAINLARAGFVVQVFEKEDRVGKRFSGDLQGLENWSAKEDVLEELEEMGIKTDFFKVPFSEITLENGSGFAKDMHFKRPVFYLVLRGDEKGSLDNTLLDQALASGVKVFFNQSIQAADADIIATGPASQKAVMIAKGIVFKTDSPDIAVGLFNDKAAYKGYSYLLVANGHGCLTTVLAGNFKSIKENFNYSKEKLLSTHPINIFHERDFGGYGHFSLDPLWQKGKNLYVGESTGLQDYFAGFGMRTAIKSGYLAARSIIIGTDYKSVANANFSNYLKATAVNRYVWEKINVKNYEFLLGKFTKYIDPGEFLLRNYNFTFNQRLIFPFAKRYFKGK